MKLNAAVLVTTPLNSIVKDELEQQNYLAVDVSTLSGKDLYDWNFKIGYASAETVASKSFRVILIMGSKSHLHQNLVGLVVDKSHTVQTWTTSLGHNVKRIDSHTFAGINSRLSCLPDGLNKFSNDDLCPYF